MCDECRDERDDDYEGDSIEAKRTKAVLAVVERHPELGIDPEEISVRFVPKAEQRCIRVDEHGKRARFEIHLPASAAVAMSSRPPLDEIAAIAWLRTDESYAALCEVLGKEPRQRFSPLYLSKAAPVDPARFDAADEVRQYEEQLSVWDDD